LLKINLESERIKFIRVEEELQRANQILKIRDLEVKHLEEISNENKGLLERIEGLNQEVN
jgi:hypothetical protein